MAEETFDGGLRAADTDGDRGWVEVYVARERRRRLKSRTETWFERCLGVAGVIGVWQALSSFGIVKPFLISSPRLVEQNLQAWVITGDFWTDVRVTLVQAGLGLAAGTLLGVTLGLLVGLRQRLSKAVQPLTVAVHAVPIVILVPLFTLWFGFGQFPKILIVTLSVFFVIFFNTLAGAGEVNPSLISGMSLMGSSRADVIRQVYVPSVLCWVIVAMRSAIAYALVGAVVAEFLGSSGGLGYAMQYAAQFLDMARVFAVLIVLAVLGILLSSLVDLLERRTLMRWR